MKIDRCHVARGQRAHAPLKKRWVHISGWLRGKLSQPEFTLLKKPGMQDLAELFERLTGRKLTETEKREAAKILAEKDSAAGAAN